MAKKVLARLDLAILVYCVAASSWLACCSPLRSGHVEQDDWYVTAHLCAAGKICPE
jgi:hypothetical protein